MTLEIGQPVDAKDGESIGRVDRVVLNAAHRRVDQIVVDRGILAADRLIDRDLIADVDDAGVWLTIDAAAVDRLPAFVEPPGPPPFDPPFPPALPIADDKLLYAAPPLVLAGAAWEGTSFALDEEGPGSRLPDGEVQIDRGAEVVDSDGHRVGVVHDLYVDPTGTLTGLLVRTGHLVHRDLAIPEDWIAAVADDLVRLTVSATDLRHRPALAH